jgi:hypothetical protein
VERSPDKGYVSRELGGFAIVAALLRWRGRTASAANLTAMGPIRSIWASVQGDPVFMRRVNGWLTMFWLAMIPVSLVTGWVNSVVYVSALSLWALVSGHWSAWQAARVEVNQAEDLKAHAAEDLPGDIGERVVEETNVELSP